MLSLQRSLLARIVVSFFLLCFLIVVLMAGLTLVFFVRDTARRVVESMDALSTVKVEMLDRWVNDQKRLVLFFADIPEVQAAAARLSAAARGNADPAYGDLSRLVSLFKADYPEIEEVLVLSRDGGRVLFSTQKLHEGQYRVLDTAFTEGLKGPFVQNVYPSPVTLQPSMSVATPLRDVHQQASAVLVFNLFLGGMDGIVRDRTGLGDSGEAYLVDRYNVFVSGERFGRAGYARGVHSAGIDAAVMGESGSGEYPNYAGLPVIGVYRWIPERSLALIVEIHQDEAFAQVRIRSAQLAAIGLAFALASAAAVSFLARRIARPILAVQEAARRISGGDFAARAPVLTRDEIGALADSFNLMTDRVTGLNEQLARREEHFRSLLENSTDLIVVFDSRVAPIFVSPSIEKVLGWTQEEFLGTAPFALVHPDDLERVRAAAQGLMTRDPTWPLLLTFRARCKDGQWRTLDTKGRNLLGHPAINGTVLNARDITDRRALEEKLAESQKLEAVGRLAGGVAHDFNNLLTALLGYSEAVLAETLGGQVREWVLEIKKAAHRAASLTRQLLAYSRKQVLLPRIVDVNDLVGNMRGMLERLIGEDVELATHLQPQLLRVTADPNQLEQVVMNLAVNARDAMPTGGRLTFKTANVTVGDNGMAGSPEVASGSYAELAVSDSGMGMDPEVRGRIFEPFFTTKEIGKGTGLGLSVAYGIVRQSGGYIVVESEPGHGSTFRILLPATVEAAAASVEEARAPFLPAGSETILIVEDEEAVRVMMATLLMHAGYVVHAEEAPKAAIEWAHAAPRLDLVVTDVVMPQMNGRIMAGALLETFPRAKVLFVSGYTEDEVVRNQALEERVHFLPKPFLPKDLIVKVREILDS